MALLPHPQIHCIAFQNLGKHTQKERSRPRTETLNPVEMMRSQGLKGNQPWLAGSKKRQGIYLQRTLSGTEPGPTMNREICAVTVGLTGGHVRALEAMALTLWIRCSQNRPPGQGTQTGRGLQVIRAVPVLQETAGKQGRHDLEGE